MMMMSLNCALHRPPPVTTAFESVIKFPKSFRPTNLISTRGGGGGRRRRRRNHGGHYICAIPTRDRCSAKGIAFVMGLSLFLNPGMIGGYGDEGNIAHAYDFSLGFFERTPTIEKDPVEPFTLYGSIFKKYFIENLVDGKVVSRKKGFTSTACVNALEASKETPELQGIPGGLKVVLIGDPLCSKSEGKTREETCPLACTSSCKRAVRRHLEEVTKETGYMLDPKDTSKAMEACSNQCTNECLKPGKTTSFIYPFRPSK